MPIIARELDYSTPQEHGEPIYDFPFEKNGDFSTFTVTRRYKQTQAGWRNDLLAGRYRLGVVNDVEHGTAFLIENGKPSPTETGLFAFTRTFCKIPTTQTEPTSLFVTKPTLESFATEDGSWADYTGSIGSAGGGTAYTNGANTFIGSTAYSRSSGSSTMTPPSGGTFTLTYKASTTAALAYNAADATIIAALNGLASVTGDGLTFTCVNGLAGANPILALTLTAGSTTTPVTMSPASLTPTGATSAFTWVITAASQSIYIGSRVTLTAHGFSSSDNLLVYLSGGYSLLAPTTRWTVIDANTIAFWSRGQVGSPYTLFGQESFTYAPGTALTRAKRVTDFYLPGVTPGIATADDIPLPTYQGDAESLVAQIIAGNTAINYEVGELTRWRDSPILARTITTINGTQL